MKQFIPRKIIRTILKKRIHRILCKLNRPDFICKQYESKGNSQFEYTIRNEIMWMY